MAAMAMSSVREGSHEQAFKDAMASFPSGVAIVTTADESGRWWGFTASSVCSVSLQPPLVLTCLARSAQCHQVFADADRWIINVVHADHAELAGRFATRGGDKFASATFEADERGLPVLPSAPIILDCSKHDTLDGGDHTILLGRVHGTGVGQAAPAVYFRRGFHRLE